MNAGSSGRGRGWKRDHTAIGSPADGRGRIAVLDACVLYPAPLRDLMIQLAVLGLYHARWTDQIHDEWMRSLLRDRPDLSREHLDEV